MANGAKLATGWLELVVATPGAQKQITDAVVPAASKAGAAGGSSIGSALLGGIKRFAAPIAAIAAGFGIKKVISDSEQAFMGLAASTNALQRIAGGTKQEVSGLAGAMKLAGVNSDQVMGSLTIFSKNLGNASADGDKARTMTERLGTSFLDAAGNVKPMAQILAGLADKFKSMPDGAQKTALATQLFGRSGAQLLPFLNKGSAGIAELTTQAGKMGLVLDDVSGRIFSEARVSTRNYQAATQGLMVQLGQNLVPVLDSVKNIFRSAMIPALQAVTGFLINNRDGFLRVAEAAQGFADRVSGGITGLFALVARGDVTGGLLKALGVQEDSGVINFLLTVRDTIVSVVSTLSSSFGAVFQALAPAFAQLGPVFAQLLPPLLQLWQSLSPVSLLMSALLPVLPQIASVVGQLAASIGGALGAALQVILPVIAQVSGTLVTLLSGILSAVLPVIVQLATTLGGVLATAITTVAPIIAQIASVLGTVLSSVLTALMPLITMLATLFGQVLQAVMPLIAPILGLIAPLLGLISPILQLVGALLTPLIQLLTVLLQPIIALIQPILGLLVPVLQLVATVLAAVIQWVVQAITWFVNFVTGQKQAGQQFQAVWSAVMGFFAGVGRFFANIWNGLISGISGFVGQVVGFFQSIPQKIISVFAGAGSWLFTVGKNLIQGLLDGAGGLLRNLGSFFLSIIPGWIVGPFKAALGIASPSRVFMGLGANITQGLILGVNGGQGALDATMRGLVSVPALNGGVGVSQSGVFPKNITLVDEDGSIIARTRAEIDRSQQDTRTSISTGHQSLGF